MSASESPRSWRFALIAAAGALAAASPAGASTEGLEHVAADAELVVRLEIPTLDAVIGSVSSWNAGNRLATSLVRSGVASALGFDPISPAAWQKRGLDTARPIWVSVSLDTSALEDRYGRMMRNDDWSARRMAKARVGFWRIRVVAAATDPAAFVTWMRAATPGVTWKKGRRRGRAIAEIGHVASAGAWILWDMPRPDVVVVDIVRPVFGAALAAPPLATIIREAAPPRPAQSFGALKRSRAAASLARPGVAVWLRAATLTRLGRALAREAHIAQVSRTKSLRVQGPMQSHELCHELSRVAQRGVFEDGALRLWSARPGDVSLDVVLGADARALATLFSRSDHALPAHRLARTVAWAALWPKSPRGFRDLRRSRAMRAWPETLRLLRQCAPQHTLSAQIFGWPELIGLFFDEIAALGPRAAIVAADASGASASISTLARDPMHMTAVLEGSLSARLTPIVSGSLTTIFGDPSKTADGERWGRGRLRPYIRADRVGTTLGGDAGVRWLSRARVVTAPAWLKGDEIAALWLDLSRSASTLAGWAPALSVLEGAGGLRSRLVVNGDRLVLENRITRQ